MQNHEAYMNSTLMGQLSATHREETASRVQEGRTKRQQKKVQHTQGPEQMLVYCALTEQLEHCGV